MGIALPPFYCVSKELNIPPLSAKYMRLLSRGVSKKKKTRKTRNVTIFTLLRDISRMG